MPARAGLHSFVRQNCHYVPALLKNRPRKRIPFARGSAAAKGLLKFLKHSGCFQSKGWPSAPIKNRNFFERVLLVRRQHIYVESLYRLLHLPAVGHYFRKSASFAISDPSGPPFHFPFYAVFLPCHNEHIWLVQ